MGRKQTQKPLKAGLALALALGGFMTPAGGLIAAAEQGQHRLDELYGRLELSFEANWGQADPSARFLARGSGYSMLLTPTEVILALSRREEAGPIREARAMPGESTGERRFGLVRIRLVGSDSTAQIRGDGLLPGKVNYFSGRDPAGWHTDIPTYRSVRVEGVYAGVDLVYYGNQRELEFDFVVAPGANPDSIRLAYEGVEDLRVGPGGDLVLRTALGEVRQHSPSVYQEIDGELKRIQATHVLLGERQVGFQVQDYDRKRPLVIDPTLTYSTLLGGSDTEAAIAMTVDSSGSAYVTGVTTSTNFPVSAPYQGTAGPNGLSAFVAKLNPTGTALDYATYLHGGDGTVQSVSIAVDSAGSAYVGGYTTSHNLPTTAGAFQPTTNDGSSGDGFITKLSPRGSQLVFSTYISGSSHDHDEVDALKVDSKGAVYAVGDTLSGSSFPTTVGAFQTTSGGGLDDFVLKLEPTGASLAYSTFLGGEGKEGATDIAVDAAGNAYVAGWTESQAFPTTPGAYRTAGGQKDAFVAKLNSAGSALVYSSRFGGSGLDAPVGLAIDALGNAYVVGYTVSANFPPTTGAFQAVHKGGEDAFALKLDPSGSIPLYATLLGGSGSERAYKVAVDPAGNAYVAGQTDSPNFPVSADAIQRAYGGTTDCFVTVLNPVGTGLPFSTYLGGGELDACFGIALDKSGFAYVAGATRSANFPTTSGSFQPGLSGPSDTFMAKLDIAVQAALTLSIVSGNGQTGTIGAALPAPIIVELRDGGAPVAGATVTFSSTGANLAPGSVRTGADGRASSFATPTAAGTITINVTAPNVTPVVFTLTAQRTAPPVAVLSAASRRTGCLAPGMIASVSGQGFAIGTYAPVSASLPTKLGGVTLTVQDSPGTERPAPLFFTSAQQIYFYLPSETQGGPATIRITGSDARVQTANVVIESVCPGLFSMNADGRGVAAGNAVRVSASGVQTPLDIVRYDGAQGKWVGQPTDFGAPTDRIFLLLYGTGFRNRTSLGEVNVIIGSIQVQANYLGPQGTPAGLDQLKVELPRAMAGGGEVPISLTVDGKTANTVTVTVGGT